MELEMIFLTGVLGIAGIHLLFSIVNYLAGSKRAYTQKSSKARGYDDWYVFFKKSDLYGDMTGTAAESTPTCDKICQSQVSYQASR